MAQDALQFTNTLQHYKSVNTRWKSEIREYKTTTGTNVPDIANLEAKVNSFELIKIIVKKHNTNEEAYLRMFIENQQAGCHANVTSNFGALCTVYA